MEIDKITLKESEFKKLIACGFITGYRFALEHGFRDYSMEDLQNASKPAEEKLWVRVKKAEVYEERQGLR